MYCCLGDEFGLLFDERLVLEKASVQEGLEYLINTVVSHEFPILLTGNSGTGKTAIIKKWLYTGINPKKQLFNSMIFSARVTCS